MPNPSRSRITVEIRTVQQSLSALDGALRRLASAIGTEKATGPAPARTSTRKRSRPKLKLSASRRAALELQGRYMGYLRNLKPKQKIQVKELRAKKGSHAAIALAKRLGNI